MMENVGSMGTAYVRGFTTGNNVNKVYLTSKELNLNSKVSAKKEYY